MKRHILKTFIFKRSFKDGTKNTYQNRNYSGVSADWDRRRPPSAAAHSAAGTSFPLCGYTANTKPLPGLCRRGRRRSQAGYLEPLNSYPESFLAYKYLKTVY